MARALFSCTTDPAGPLADGGESAQHLLRFMVAQFKVKVRSVIGLLDALHTSQEAQEKKVAAAEAKALLMQRKEQRKKDLVGAAQDALEDEPEPALLQYLKPDPDHEQLGKGEAPRTPADKDLAMFLGPQS